MSQRTSFAVHAFMGVSLDGYIAGENGDLSWLTCVETDPPEDTGYELLMATVDAIVIGRNTYDVVRCFPDWLYKGKRVVVLSHREFVPVHGEERYEGDVQKLCNTLHKEGVRAIYLDGGLSVCLGLQAGIVTHVTLNWVPVLLGKGIPLFTEQYPMSSWTLVAVNAFPSGLVQASYTAAPIE